MTDTPSREGKFPGIEEMSELLSSSISMKATGGYSLRTHVPRINAKTGRMDSSTTVTPAFETVELLEEFCKKHIDQVRYLPPMMRGAIILRDDVQSKDASQSERVPDVTRWNVCAEMPGHSHQWEFTSLDEAVLAFLKRLKAGLKLGVPNFRMSVRAKPIPGFRSQGVYGHADGFGIMDGDRWTEAEEMPWAHIEQMRVYAKRYRGD